MKESWFCRDYEAGDEHQILALFKEVFDEEQGLGFWRWKFIQSPFGEGIVKLLFDRSKLIAHYAAIPMEVQVGNTVLKAIWSIDTMTHPDYRGHGIFPYLATEVYEECRLKGFRFVYGFPNELIYPIRIKKLGWKGFGKMSILRKELGKTPSEYAFIEDSYQICRVERFGEDVDSLWHKVKGHYNIILPRTKDYLNWRFAEHPNVKYANYVIRGSDADALGYIALKIFTTEKERKGHIVDILSLDNKDIIRQLIRCAYNYFAENGINNVSCWMQDNYLCADVMKEEGFVREEIPGPHPYFGVRVFDQGDIAIKNIECFSNWYLTMGDCDVF